VIYPNKSISIYTKQYLHDGEELFYSSSMSYNPIIQLGGEQVSLAICADINNENHPCQAKENGSTIYLPCIFYSKDGMDKGYEQLKKYAEKYSLNILMSNYSGELWNIQSGGKSAFWNSTGELVDNLDSNDSGLLIAEKKNGNWKTKKLVTTKYKRH
jgi:predicted amidohydrolase